MAKPLHALTLTGDPDISPGNAAPKAENDMDSAVPASLVMQNQGGSHEQVRYPDRMQRVALLM